MSFIVKQKHEELYREAEKKNVKPICQSCQKECEVSEIVDTGESYDLWNYCKSCDIETFHLILDYTNET